MRSKSNQPKIVAVVGPTLSGKTKLGLTLAERFNGVIISADSRQVYRGLDVGTNKEGQPGQWRHHPARYIDGIPQLIIDIADPGERFTLADWLKQARALAEEIWQAGQLPIVVGGTGLYVRALIENWQLGGQNPQLRQKLEMMSLIELQEQARDLGLNESDWQNRRRLVRTLERQQSPSQVVDSPTNQQSLVIMPIVERSVLYQKSDARVEQIFPRLCREVKELTDRGVSAQWLDDIGLEYRFASRFVRGDLTDQEAVGKLQRAVRSLIRRQITWWKTTNNVKSVEFEDKAAKLVERFLAT